MSTVYINVSVGDTDKVVQTITAPTDITAATIEVAFTEGAPTTGDWHAPSETVTFSTDGLTATASDLITADTNPAGLYECWIRAVSGITRSKHTGYLDTTGPAASSTWATVDEVAGITGRTVTDVQVEQAQAVIDLYANRTVDDEDAIAARDQNWLKKAVAYQAAWMLDQPGYTSRSAVTGVNQDGDITQFTSDRSVTLAPLAMRALGNLSWKRTRTLFTEPEFARLRSRILQPGEGIPEGWDDEHPWAPMEYPR